MDFSAEMTRLDQRGQALADKEGAIFVPNQRPRGPVDHVLICMEPSLGPWARAPEQARILFRSGFLNFRRSVEDFILHTAVRRYLCQPGETYHVTDLSKGAMSVHQAKVDRESRYDRWFGLLEDEIRWVAKPTARFFAVGRVVETSLRALGFSRPFKTLMHYSGQAGSARRNAIAGHEKEFDAFARSVSLQDILDVAAEVFSGEGESPDQAQETLGRLRRSELTASRKMLLFAYRSSFGIFKD